MKQKKIPLRKCVGCHTQKQKKQLIRVVKNNTGDIFIDLTGKANGRGAYICPSLECLRLAMKKDGLSRALETRIDAQLYKILEADLAAKDMEIRQLQEEAVHLEQENEES